MTCAIIIRNSEGGYEMIEIYLLEQLTAVARCGTLSAASEELHMTQPALSKSMQKLENILELNLFDRKKNKIAINETGILAAELAEQLLKQEENMIVQLRHFDKSKHTIALGSCAPILLDGELQSGATAN